MSSNLGQSSSSPRCHDMSLGSDIGSSGFPKTQKAFKSSDTQERGIINRNTSADSVGSSEGPSTAESSESKLHSSIQPYNAPRASAESDIDSDDNFPNLEDLFEIQETLSE